MSFGYFSNTFLIAPRLDRRIDRLLTQQIFVRRFKGSCNDDYEKLIPLRRVVFDLLAEFWGVWGAIQYESHVLHVVRYFLSFLDVKWGRAAIDEVDVQAVVEYRFFEEMRIPFDGGRYIEPVLNVLRGHLAFVEGLLDKYNYFEYMTLPVLMSMCDGRLLYLLHANNALLKPYFYEGLNKIESNARFNLLMAIKTSRMEYFFSSTSVQVYLEQERPSREVDIEPREYARSAARRGAMTSIASRWRPA